MRAMILIVLAVAACRPSAAPTPPARAAASADESGATGAELADQIRTVLLHMHVRFAAARRIEQAIAFADLDRARGEAKIILELDEPDILPVWQPYLEHLREAARQVSVASNLVAAANTSAILGHQCAQCHVAAKAKITLPGRPGAAPGRAARRRHGEPPVGRHPVVGRADPAVDRALGTRARPRWCRPRSARPPKATSRRSGRCPDDVARVRLLARRALEATSLDARARTYGELLATCAGCHATIRD
jgi:hypothetical protein